MPNANLKGESPSTQARPVFFAAMNIVHQMHDHVSEHFIGDDEKWDFVDYRQAHNDELYAFVERVIREKADAERETIHHILEILAGNGVPFSEGAAEGVTNAIFQRNMSRANNGYLREVHAELVEALEEAKRTLYSIDNHVVGGLIPLLEELQKQHPDFAPDSIAGAIDQLKNGEDGEGYGHPDTALEIIEAALSKARGKDD